MHVGELLAQILRAGETIEHEQLVGGLEQVLVVVLAVHIDQQFTDGAEHGGGGRPAVD